MGQDDAEALARLGVARVDAPPFDWNAVPVTGDIFHDEPNKRLKANQGTVNKRARNSQGVWTTQEQAQAIVDHLPEFSATRWGEFPVQARFQLMLETGLRPRTIDQLRVPEHYRRGDTHLNITADIDKIGYARKLPLTPDARKSLDSICPDHGEFFGRHDYRDVLRKAAKEVLPEPEASLFTAYDFRRRALTRIRRPHGRRLHGGPQAADDQQHLHPAGVAVRRADAGT